MHDKTHHNIAINHKVKTYPFFKIKFSRWFEFNNENNNFKYAAESVNILIIIF